MREWHIPLVMVTRYVPGVECDYVGNDNRLGLILATRHLLELGHRRLAFIGYNKRTTTGRDRFAGFRSALKEAGVTLARARGRVRRESTGRLRWVRRLSERRARRRRWSAHDLLAYGVMLGCAISGWRPGASAP